LAKVLKDRRSQRERGRMGTSVRDATRRDLDSISIRSRFRDSNDRTRTVVCGRLFGLRRDRGFGCRGDVPCARSERGEARQAWRGEAGGRNERMNRRRPRTAPGEKVLKDRRSRRERGRVGTSVNGADRARGRGGTRGPDPSLAGDRDAARGSSDAPVVSVVVAAAGVALGGPRAVRHRPPRRDVPASARPRANRSVLLR
jgi:hypothetical protein